MPIRNILIEGFSEVETQLYAEYTNTNKSIMFYLIDVFSEVETQNYLLSIPIYRSAGPVQGQTKKHIFKLRGLLPSVAAQQMFVLIIQKRQQIMSFSTEGSVAVRQTCLYMFVLIIPVEGSVAD